MQSIQLKMARAALDLSPDDLAAKAGVDRAAITRLEEGQNPDGATTRSLNLFFSAEGIEWIDSDGVRAKGKAGKDFVTVESLTSDNDGGEG